MSLSSGTQRRCRVLFFAEAVTLAHVARPRVLAAALDPDRFDVQLAVAPRFEGALSGLTLRRWSLASIEPDRFLRSLARGTPLYDSATLERYVADDLELIRRIEPDVVVGDFRLSLAVSAPMAGVPYIALANAYWSPFAVLDPWPVPEIPPVRVFGEGIARWVFNRIRPAVFRNHARPLNQVRRQHGLAGVGDMLHAYTWGDETLYLDPPGLVPMRPLPPHHRLAGPVLWEPESRLPTWWDALDQARPTVYLTLGSSGAASRLPGLARALAGLPINLVVSTAGRVDLRDLPRNVWSADYLPGATVAGQSALVISNGGSPTGYQALSQGTPVLGVPMNLDQHLATTFISNTGAGALLRSDRATPERLRAAVESMLGQPDLRASAARVRGWFADQDPSQVLAERILALARGCEVAVHPCGAA